MFKDTLIKVYATPDSVSYIKSIDADVQPFSKSITFEDGFQIDITSRLFCDIDDSITEESYIEELKGGSWTGAGSTALHTLVCQWDLILALFILILLILIIYWLASRSLLVPEVKS